MNIFADLTALQIENFAIGVLLVLGIIGILIFAAWPLPIDDGSDENNGDC